MSLVLAAALALPGAHFPGLWTRGGFVTPSGNIACNVGGLGATRRSPLGIGCAVFSRSGRRGIATWWMRTRGRASSGYVQANPATDYPTLRYGRVYAWHGIRCVSASTGLTCRNASGHGFALSRERQRLF